MRCPLCLCRVRSRLLRQTYTRMKAMVVRGGCCEVGDHLCSIYVVSGDHKSLGKSRSRLINNVASTVASRVGHEQTVCGSNDSFVSGYIAQNTCANVRYASLLFDQLELHAG